MKYFWDTCALISSIYLEEYIYRYVSSLRDIPSDRPVIETGAGLERIQVIKALAKLATSRKAGVRKQESVRIINASSLRSLNSLYIVWNVTWPICLGILFTGMQAL